jgi:hypothetical protein
VTETPSPTIEERLAALEVLATVPVILEPGATLIIRVADLTPDQIRDYQQALDFEHEHGHFPPTIVVYGDELAAARPKPGADAITALTDRALELT